MTHALSCDALSVISDSTNTMISNMTMTASSGLVYDPGNGEMYISNWYENSVTMIADSYVLPPPSYVNPPPTYTPIPTMIPPPVNLSIPFPTNQPEPSLTVSSTPTASHNSVTTYTSAATGVNVTVNGPTVQDGTQVNVTATKYGSKPPTGIAKASLGETLFYDISATSNGEAFNSDTNATISIIDPTFSNISIMEYWNGNTWISVDTNFNPPNVVSCTVPASVLTGTPFAVGTKLSTNSKSSFTEIIYGLVAGLAISAIVIVALLFTMRGKESKTHFESDDQQQMSAPPFPKVEIFQKTL